MTRVEPVVLTEVIAVALSPEAYQFARGGDSLLQKWLFASDNILHHGSTHSYENELQGGESLVYRLEMLQPVLQGQAKMSHTKFIVIASEEQSVGNVGGEDGLQDHLDDEQDGIEIDEDFLSSSLVSPGNMPFQHRQLPNGHLTNGSAFSTQDMTMTHPCFTPQPIPSRISSQNDHCTLYLRTLDLSKAGLLSGDWAIACSQPRSNARLVRVVANDYIAKEIGTVILSPELLYNLNAQSAGPISLCPSPFGSLQPMIPIASSVTVARIASPVSINREYQTHLLHSLKLYLDGAKRLVKIKDVFAVPVDMGNLADNTADDEENHRSTHKFPALDDIAFFIITNINYSTAKASSSSTDVVAGLESGELGCWIDSAVTQLTQTGVEHSWVPNLGDYYGMSKKRRNHKMPNLAGKGSPFNRLKSLTSAILAQRAADFQLNLSILLKGPRGVGKFTTATWVAKELGMHLFEVDCFDIIGDNDVQTEGIIRSRFEQARSCAPSVIFLRRMDGLARTSQIAESKKDPVMVNVLQECIEDACQSWKSTGFPVVVFASTHQADRLPTGLLALFKHEINFEAPSEGQRREILDSILNRDMLASDVSISSIATQTAALVASDLVNLVARARHASVERATDSLVGHPRDALKSGTCLTAEDFQVALGKARSLYSEGIGAPKIPNVSWDDVGGLATVKSDILDTIQLPLDHPELFSNGLKKRSGILLYGPPGTGKTLLAKAVATSCSLNFFSVKGPELLNMYIGESEANVRRIFHRARAAKPCVIFFDELDSVAPKRGNHGDSGGVMDRIVSQLLAELDGMSGGDGGADVFVIGATNRPDLLDPALLRPGRFDRMLYLGVSETHEAQLNILEALTRKFRLHPNLDLKKLAMECPFNYTGADFYALCSDAMLQAMSRTAESLEATISHLNSLPGPYSHPHPLTPQYYLAEMATEDEIRVLVTQDDFDHALRGLVPSVSKSEMDHYAHIQRRFSHREEEAK
ncbi:AAA-domain-containing protein [Infundibulicybe gibba]|nr:AAA-domain-containing protein [Infundibulicybe gibba]